MSTAGGVDVVQSQLRTSLITELQLSVDGSLVALDHTLTNSDGLVFTVANSLVACHLRKANFEYSLGVFLSESGLQQHKECHQQDFLTLLHITPQSQLYKQLQARLESDVDKDAKLRSLEDLYLSKKEDSNLVSRNAYEERLLSFQRKLEDRYDTQLKMEVARLKDSELSRLRTEETDAMARCLERSKTELQKQYQEKFDGLLVKERNMVERVKKEQELQEKEVYSRRQMLLSEVDALHQRQAEFKRETEGCNVEKLMVEERSKNRAEEWRRREVELRSKELQFDQRLQSEIAQCKLDQHTIFINRLQSVEMRESKVRDEERILCEEKSKIEKLTVELRDKTHQVDNLESALQEARHSQADAIRQNELINCRLREMADYKSVKEQSVSQRSELESLRMRLDELLNINKRERGRQEELLRELRRPSPETLMLHRELDRSRENLRQETAIFAQQKQLLESRLNNELGHNQELVHCIEKQTLQMEEVNKEVVYLQKQQSLTKIALSSEARHGSESHGFARPVDERSAHPSPRLATTYHKTVTSGHHPHTGSRPRTCSDLEIYNSVDLDVDVHQFRSHADITDSSDDPSSGLSADIVVETRHRLRQLEEEARHLEQAYHNFYSDSAVLHNIKPSTERHQVSTDHLLPARSLVVVDKSTTLASDSQRPDSPLVDSRPMSSTPCKRTLGVSGHGVACLASDRPDSPLVDSRPMSSTPCKRTLGVSGHGGSHLVADDTAMGGSFIETGGPMAHLVVDQTAVDQPAVVLCPSFDVSDVADNASVHGAIHSKGPNCQHALADDAAVFSALSVIPLAATGSEGVDEESSPCLEEVHHHYEVQTVQELEKDRPDERLDDTDECMLGNQQKACDEDEKSADCGVIDPVMLQYMAQVEAMNKQQERTEDRQENSISCSDDGISAVDICRSDNDFDDIW